MGQIVHPDASRVPTRPLVHGLVSAAVVAAACAGMLTGCGSSLAHAATTVSGAMNASVVHADGQVVPAVDGLRLRRGDVVRTAADGRAELHTRGRVVYEGSDAAVAVVDGGHADLRHGAVVVDAQRGAGVALSVAGVTVSAPHGSAVRAERSATVRVATLAGRAGVDNDGGRHLDVPALTQAVLSGDALPGSTASSPLRLTDDDGEAHAVPSLVHDDVALIRLATGIDTTGSTAASAVTAAWHSSLSSLPAGVARSEQVLPLVIAATSPVDPATRYRDAVELRRAGASWGVVTARLHTSSAAVLAALDLFEHSAHTGQVGSIAAAVAALRPVVAGNSTPGANSSGSGNGSGDGSGARPRPQPSGSPSPSPSSGDLLSRTIDEVLSLLPSPSPSSSSGTLLPVPLPTVKVPVPLPVPTVQLPVVPVQVTPAPLPLTTP